MTPDLEKELKGIAADMETSGADHPVAWLPFLRAAAAAAERLEVGRDRWISVDDSVPKIGATVLVWRPNHNDVDLVTYTQKSDDHRRFIRHEDNQWWDRGRRITHWQPLPDPPANAIREDKG